MPRKQKRRLEPAYLIAHGDVEEVRFQAGNYWHTATPAGLTFNCKCQAGQHTVTWQEDIPLILAILSAHRDQLWKVLCDGERMLLARPDAGYKGKRLTFCLVGVIWPTDEVLTFVSFRE